MWEWVLELPEELQDPEYPPLPILYLLADCERSEQTEES